MNNLEEYVYSVRLNQRQMKYIMWLIENQANGFFLDVSMQELREMWWAFDDPLDIVYNDGERPDFIEGENHYELQSET